jgi:hypothetical protein
MNVTASSNDDQLNAELSGECCADCVARLCATLIDLLLKVACVACGTLLRIPSFVIKGCCCLCCSKVREEESTYECIFNANPRCNYNQVPLWT